MSEAEIAGLLRFLCYAMQLKYREIKNGFGDFQGVAFSIIIVRGIVSRVLLIGK